MSTSTSTDWLSVAEAAARVGVTHETIRDHINSGRLRAYQPGSRRGRIFIAPTDLSAWILGSPIGGHRALDDADYWRTPVDENDLVMCDEATGFIEVVSSKMGEFLAARAQRQAR